MCRKFWPWCPLDLEIESKLDISFFLLLTVFRVPILRPIFHQKPSWGWVTNVRKKGRQTNEIDAASAMPMQMLANATIFRLLTLGVTLERLDFALGPQQFALGS